MSRLTRRTFLGVTVGGFLAALGLKAATKVMPWRTLSWHSYPVLVDEPTGLGMRYVSNWPSGTCTLKKSVPITFRGKWIPYEPESRG